MAGANDTVLGFIAEVGFKGDETQRAWGKIVKKMEGTLASSVGAAIKGGFGTGALTHMAKKLMDLDNKRKQAQAAALVKQEKMEAAWASQSFNLEEFRATQLAHQKAKEDAERLEGNFKKEADHITKMGKKREASVKRAAKWLESGEAAEAFGNQIQSAFSDLKGGDLGGLFKKGGALAKGMGGLADKAGAKMGGKAGGAMSGIGGALSSLGPALMAIGGVVAGFAAIIGMIAAVDSAGKEMNKSFLDAGATVGDMGAGLGDVDKKMDAVRNTFADAVSYNIAFGTTAKENLEILGRYSEVGLTFKEIGQAVSGATDQMEALMTATKMTLTYSKLFGVSQNEMVTHMADWMEELGMNFKSVSESLSAVYSAAKDSGFGVKRFYGMVQQATSGMSMYNVRLEETASLLIRMGKILGSQRAGAFVQQLGKGFGDMGMQERYKRTKLMGGKSKGIFGRDAEMTARAFAKKLEDANMGPAFAEAAKRAGVNLDPSNQKAMIATLGNLDRKKQARLMAEVGKEKNDPLTRQLRNLVSVSRGARGGTANMAMEMGSLSMGGKLAAQLASVTALTSKPIHAMGIKELMATEQLAGFTGEQLEEMRRVSETLYGQWDSIKAQAKDNKDNKKYDEKLAIDNIKSRGFYADAQGKIWKASLDKQGKIDTANQVEIKNRDEFIQSNGEELVNAVKAGVPDDIKLAKQIASSTTSMSHILDVTITKILNDMYGVLQSIRNWLTGLDETEKVNREILLSESKKRNKELTDAISTQQKLKAGLETELTLAKGGDKAAIQEKIKKSERRLGLLGARQQNEAVAVENLMTAEGKGPGMSWDINQLALSGGSPEMASNVEAVVGKKEFEKITREYFQSAREILGKEATAEEVGNAARMLAAGAYGGVPTREGEGDPIKRITGSIDREALKEKQRADEASKERTKKAPEATADALFKKMKADKEAASIEELTEMLAAAGSAASYESRKSMATSMVEGTATKQTLAELQGTARGGGTIAQALEGKKFPGRAGEVVRKALGQLPKGEDFLFRSGAGGTQAALISPQDAVLAAKPGGPFSKATGGGSVNVYHLYNDGPGVMASIRKAQSAGALG